MSFCKDSRAKSLIDKIGQLEIFPSGENDPDFEEDEVILLRVYLLSIKEKLTFFNKIRSNFVTLPEYIEMYYYAVSQYNLQAVNYLLTNNIVRIDDKFENVSILGLASVNDDMYMTLLNSGLNINIYMHRQVFLRNAIITKDLHLYMAYLDRANVHLLLCKLDQNIVSDDIMYSRGDSIIDILVKINNPSMNEYMIKWLKKKLDEQNMAKAEKERITKIIVISLAVLYVVAVGTGGAAGVIPMTIAAQGVACCISLTRNFIGTMGGNINWSANISHPPKSKGEGNAFKVFERLFINDEIQTNIRPFWLRNPDTDCNSELTGFIPNRKIAYEIYEIEELENATGEGGYKKCELKKHEDLQSDKERLKQKIKEKNKKYRSLTREYEKIKSKFESKNLSSSTNPSCNVQQHHDLLKENAKLSQKIVGYIKKEEEVRPPELWNLNPYTNPKYAEAMAKSSMRMRLKGIH